jgi:hypothetical protein
MPPQLCCASGRQNRQATRPPVERRVLELIQTATWIFFFFMQNEFSSFPFLQKSIVKKS